MASPAAVTDRAQVAAALCARFPTLRVQPLTTHTLSLHTRLRATTTPTAAFVSVADQLLRQLVETALSTLPVQDTVVQTPTGSFSGCSLTREVVGVSIMRAGESMECALRHVIPGVRIGKLLIQRDESVKEKPARFIYAKMPPGVAECSILLLDPMLASGGSSICAIRHLLSSTAGLTLDQITFVCLIACPEGIQALLQDFPTLNLVVGCVDERLDERKFIVPGVGDFGDRYFGTVAPHE